MLKENLTPTIIKEKVSQFLKNNGTIYTEEEKKIILDNCLMGLYTDFPDTFIRQVYAELDLMDPSHNIYLGFINAKTIEIINKNSIPEFASNITPRYVRIMLAKIPANIPKTI